MKKEEILALFKSYEEAACTIDNTECWSARELCGLLGYTQWRNFSNVIDKAKEACNNAGQSAVDYHSFLEARRKLMAQKVKAYFNAL